MPALNQRIISGLFFITMETFTISKELLVEMAGWGNSKDNKRIRELFPEAFEPELKTGIWYKSTNEEKNTYKNLFLFVDKINKDTISGYGFNENGLWIELDCLKITVVKNQINPATEEEVFERLKEEAVKRGFKKGVTVDMSAINKKFSWFKSESNELETNENLDLFLDYRLIFRAGKWAEICITKEEAEKELGKKII